MKLDVSSYISELLFENDCVVLPDFGGFVASYKPSSIEFGDGTVNPPSKSISFNKSLTLNDGLLINHIVKKEGLSYEETKKKVEKFAKKCNRALAENETVVFPKVGKVFYDVEKNLKFEADAANFLSDSYGLPTVMEKPEVSTTTTTTEPDKPQTLHERLAAQSGNTLEEKKPEAKPTTYKTTEKTVVTKKEVETKPATVKTAATATSATKVSNQRYTGNAPTKKEESIGLIKWLPFLAYFLVFAILGVLAWGFIQGLSKDGDTLANKDNTEQPVGNEDTDDQSDDDYGGTAGIDGDELDKEIDNASEDELNEDDDDGDREMPESEFNEKVNRVSKTLRDDVSGYKGSLNSSSSSTGSREYTIVIGAFSSLTNAEARQRTLEANGLETEIGSLGRLHRVGVNIVCEPSEIEGRLRDIQEKYNKKAWLLKR